MDASPNPSNRNRNRRSDRYAEETAVTPTLQEPSTPAQPAIPRPYVPTPPPIYCGAPSRQPQVRTQAQMVSQMQTRAQAQPQYSRTPVPSAARPSPYTTYSRNPAPARAPAAPVEDEDRPGMPWQLTTALVLTFLLVLGLIAAQALMQAYLKTQADERAAAHQSLLDYYHVTEQADGSAHITYQDTIEYYADLYNLQPAYVAAIIRNESSFRTDAESSVGARGLMQLMPDTAEWIARKLDIPSFSFDDMYNAETNIRFGTWYLNYLSDMFRGDPILVTAAYHAGQTTVTQWLSNRSISPDGVTIPLDNLMDGPTKTYAGRVTQAYGIYQALLYPGEALEDSAVPSHSTDASAPPAAPTSFIQR